MLNAVFVDSDTHNHYIVVRNRAGCGLNQHDLHMGYLLGPLHDGKHSSVCHPCIVHCHLADGAAVAADFVALDLVVGVANTR